jgi:hypothetical protein
METAIVMARTTVSQTQTAIPAATLLPSDTPLPPPVTLLPISMTPTITVMENGLQWTECVVPGDDYSREDQEFLKECVDIPAWGEKDKRKMGEHLKDQDGWTNWKTTIGNDRFETRRFDTSSCCSYELLKNGEVILKIKPGFLSFDPNQGFWNLAGKFVWEVAGSEQMIVVDGVNYNEKYQLEGSYFPYEIRGKLIYIAKQKGKFHIVYDEKVVGPEFDEISMAYCCSMISVYRGNGQYWFVGTRAGNEFVVSIR